MKATSRENGSARWRVKALGRPPWAADESAHRLRDQTKSALCGYKPFEMTEVFSVSAGPIVFVARFCMLFSKIQVIAVALALSEA